MLLTLRSSNIYPNSDKKPTWHPDAGEGGPLVEFVVLQREDVHGALVAAAAQPLVTAAEVDAVNAGLGIKQVVKLTASRQASDV